MTFRFQDLLRTGIWVGVLLILLTPLVVTKSTLFPYVVGKAIYFRSLVEIIFGMWIILALAEPRYRLTRSWIVWLFAVYVVASLASAMAGVSFQRSFWGDYRRMGGVFDLAHWLLFLVVVVSVWRNTVHWRWLLNANLGVALGISILGLAQHFNIRVFDALFWYFKPESRLDITFGNATYVAAYTLVNSLVALGFLAQSFVVRPKREEAPQERRQRARQRAQVQDKDDYLIVRRVFWGVTSLLGLWVLTLSGTRGAVLGLAAGLLAAGVAYILWGARQRIKIGVAVAIGAAVLLAVTLPLVHNTGLFQALARSNVLIQRLDSTLTLGSKDASVSSRFTVAQTGLKAFAQKPILGWGPENFAVAFDRNASTLVTPIGVQIADQAHNKPIEELTSKGIIGFVLYALIMGRLLWVLVGVVRKGPQEQPLALFILAAAVGYIVQDLFLFDTHSIFLSFALLMAWAAGREYPQSQVTEAVRPETVGSGVAPGDPYRFLPEAPSRRRGRKGQAPKESGPQGRASDSMGRSLWGMDAESRPVLVGIVAVTVAFWVAFLLFWVNYRPYHAAQLFPVQGSSVREFLANAQTSFRTFPPLATLGRQFLVDTLAENWSLTPQSDAPTVLEQMGEEGNTALRSEPQNPRIHLGLAKLYQAAAVSNRALLGPAQQLIGQARQLAPGLPGLEEAAIMQQALEEGYPQALTTLYKSIGEEPAKSSLLGGLRKDLESNLLRQIGEAEFKCRWQDRPDLTLEERAKLECLP